MSFFFDEFIWCFYTTDPIVITSDVDEDFFNELETVMTGRYYFGNNGLSLLENNRLIWLSDQYCDLGDEESTDRVSRLVIEKCADSYKMYTHNPFFSRMNISKSSIFIAFSPAGNGYCTKNMITGSTFQDDIVANLFRKRFEDKDAKHFVKKNAAYKSDISD